MRDFVKRLKAAEGWDDERTADVLADALERLVELGTDRDDVEAIVLRAGGASAPPEDAEPPEMGDIVEMEGVDCRIVVGDVPSHQPDASGGRWTIVDQYGETHVVEREDEDSLWQVVIPPL